MADWISSKLKVAETFLHQIDQQAAESLGKNDKPRSGELSIETQIKSSNDNYEIVPLKDQLLKNNNKKKSITTTETNDLIGKLPRDFLPIQKHNSNDVIASNNGEMDEKKNSPKSGLTDTDWTELLSAPSQQKSLTVNRSNGVSGSRKSRRQSGSGLNLEGKRNQKKGGQISGLRVSPKSDVVSENKVNGGTLGERRSHGEDSGVTNAIRKVSRVELGSDGSYSQGKELDGKDLSPSLVVENKNEAYEERNSTSQTHGDKEHLYYKDSSVDIAPRSTNKDFGAEMALATDGVSDLKMGEGDDHRRSGNSIERIKEPNAGLRSSSSLKMLSPSISDRVSDSDTDSTSSSDSESEREREEMKRRRAQILAEKAAAKAVEAIKERENMVARLEGEKQSLVKILEERARQQAHEASELQNTTMEMMQAVELEKQKHNNTRMEALTRLAKLETANADLARSLAAAQWNLEVEINRVAEIQRQIELKEATQEDLRRKISLTHDTGNQLVRSKGVEFEREILEAEYSFVTEKIGRLQEKVKTLETNIEMTLKEMENPTEVEVELKRRLGQLTDHLIQKQSQVEALSSEKATHTLRIEAVSRLLGENKTMLNVAGIPSNDIETGIWKLSNSKLRPLFEQRIQSGQQHLGSLVRQLDSIFCAGAVFLRRNSAARLWSLVYFVCLHFWVAYILMSHSPASDETRSGAVVSLENINYTGGV